MAPLLPTSAAPWEDWAGNRTCVSCRFTFAVFICAVEFLVISRLSGQTLKMMRSWRRSNRVPSDRGWKSSSGGDIVHTDANNVDATWLDYGLTALALAGWTYYGLIVSFFWNFISWLFIGFLFLFTPYWVRMVSRERLVAPGEKPLSARQCSAWRRRCIITAGIFLGIVSLAMYTNVPRMPTELYRRSLGRPDTLLTPNDELVLSYQDEFFNSIPRTRFLNLTFAEQMNEVDIFVSDTILWESDYGYWKMVGTMLTPHEVLERRHGDCQGQAVTTASLLLSLGFQAWVAETPFHWWTHARDPVSGEEYELNVHGSAGTAGSVEPQPIDFVFTLPQPAHIKASGVFYFAEPWRAFAIAWTGAHILVREFLPGLTAHFATILVVGVSIAVTVLATVLKGRTERETIGNIFAVFVTSVLMTLFMLGLLVFWIKFAYFVGMMHVVVCLAALLSSCALA